MKHKFFLVLIVIIIPCFQADARDFMDIDTYDRETIYIHQSFFGDGFVKDGQIWDMGFLGSNLTRNMIGSRYALMEMRKFRKYKKANIVASLAGTAFGITGLVLTFRDDAGDNLEIEITTLIIGGVCQVLAEGFNRLAAGAMNRAVWLYNRDVASGQIRITGERIRRR
jgi:hypothetical protein